VVRSAATESDKGSPGRRLVATRRHSVDSSGIRLRTSLQGRSMTVHSIFDELTHQRRGSLAAPPLRSLSLLAASVRE
jgi:hypothetical protein